MLSYVLRKRNDILPGLRQAIFAILTLVLRNTHISHFADQISIRTFFDIETCTYVSSVLAFSAAVIEHKILNELLRQVVQ